ncbi:CLUMA_CG013693, isoform A [Clunio marinus]|uniref:CLUMA_CG013693, isoform A n=1 Tax=Clunio marinus TaxID=568069 RepID=A0A1J1IJL8_9DIPT|nr:CLUMA_CG013693, isoform A [Clunio marinus]
MLVIAVVENTSLTCRTTINIKLCRCLILNYLVMQPNDSGKLNSYIRFSCYPQKKTSSTIQ